jgi:hypothetical protein
MAVLEEYLYYAERYADFFESEVNKMEFFANTRLYTFGLQKIIKNVGRLTMIIIIFTTMWHRFGLKAIILVIGIVLLIPHTEAAPASILENLQDTLTYICFLHSFDPFSTELHLNELFKMEATLIALIEKE